MKRLIKKIRLKENNIDNEDDYVIHNGEKYYLNDSYIRKELMDKLCDYAKEKLSDDSWIGPIVDDNYKEYMDNQENINVDTVFEYIKNNYPEYINICNAYYNSDYDIEEEIESLLKDHVEFLISYYVGNEDYIYDSENYRFSNAEIYIFDLLDFNLLEKIKVYDKYDEKYMEEQLITKAEVNYISEYLYHNTELFSKEEDEFYKYINERKNASLYYALDYTIYRKIDIHKFVEQLKEDYSDVFFYQSEDNSVWENEEE